MGVPDWSVAAFAALVFIFAGTVKGGLGLGLPPIAMGLLVLLMSPVQAAALIVLPALATNIGQTFFGKHLPKLVHRFWPMLLAMALLTLLGTGWLESANKDLLSAGLGLVLALYAAFGLAGRTLSVPTDWEIWLGPLVGAISGALTASTGICAVPSVPYLQAANLERDELVQGLGLLFMVANLSLTANLAITGAFSLSAAPLVAIAVASALLGIVIGSWLRSRINDALFRRIFLIGLLALGLHLCGRAIL